MRRLLLGLFVMCCNLVMWNEQCFMLPKCQSNVYLIEWQYDMYCWYVNVMCSYFMKCVDKPSSVPYERWFHPLREWVSYVCKHIWWTTLCTLISYNSCDIKRCTRFQKMHSFHKCIWIYDGFIKYLFLNKLWERNDWFKQRLLWKWNDLHLSLIHIWRCRRIERCRSRWSPYH